MTLAERDKKHLWHPLTQHKLYPDHLPIVRAKGALLYDDKGNSYIDGIASWYTCMYGHCNDRIATKIKQQIDELDQVVFSGFTHKPAIELSEKLIGILPNNQQKIFFSDNGSTSVDVAIKMALQYHYNKGEKRSKLIALEEAFHGDTFGAMSVSGLSVYNGPFEDFLLTIDRIDVPGKINLEEVCTNFEALVATGEIAAFIYEPLVQGAAAMKMHNPDFLEKILKIAGKYQVLTIADEVMTGFGNPLLDAIIKYIPDPKVEKGSLQMLITSLDYSSYVGRIAVGRVTRGEIKAGQSISLCKRDGSIKRSKIKELYVFEGMAKAKTDLVVAGDICALVGIEGFEIGDTVAAFENPEALDPISIDEPTMSMLFTINNSPFFGRDGKFVTSRHLKDRLDKELEKNLALKVEATDSADAFNVFGRGILHLSVLIETMRREGYELQVGQPQVIIKNIGGEKCEPVEQLSINLPEEYSGKAIEMVTQRRGEMLNMERKGERIHLEFKIPSRGIIGMSSSILTATAGEAVMSHRFLDFEPYKGLIQNRINGSLIAMETGTSFAYALGKLVDRGKFFIGAQEEVYEGMVVGESSRANDLVLNVTKTKKQSNVRSSGTDDKVSIAPPIKFSLEEALEYIQKDEYVEVTPKSMRLRKIKLKEFERKRDKKL